MSALLEHYAPGLDSYQPRPSTRLLFDRAWFGKHRPQPADGAAYGYYTATGTVGMSDPSCYENLLKQAREHEKRFPPGPSPSARNALHYPPTRAAPLPHLPTPSRQR